MNTPVAFVLAAMSMLNPEPVQAPEEVYCLAQNIYHEARSTKVYEQIMVAKVTVNSAINRDTTICEEVARPWRYSWTHDKKARIDLDNPIEREAWRLAVEIALLTAEDEEGDWAVTHYHDHSVDPDWGFKVVYNGPNFVFYQGRLL